MSKNDDLDSAVELFRDSRMRAWLENNSFKLTASYIQRGRVYRDLSNEALIETWIENMRRHCRHPDNRALFDTQNDIEAEMGLRRLDFPYDMVQEDLEIRRKYFAKILDDMKQHPKKWETSNQAMKDDLVDFFVELEESKEHFN